MFEQFLFIYLNCFLRTIFVRIIIFILSYYVVSLLYSYPDFLKFSVSYHVVSPWPYPSPCFIAFLYSPTNFVLFQLDFRLVPEKVQEKRRNLNSESRFVVV